MTGFFFQQVLFADVRVIMQMVHHIRTLDMDEEEAKADYARHNKEVLVHVDADKVCDKDIFPSRKSGVLSFSLIV